jgi:hypothetical protein
MTPDERAVASGELISTLNTMNDNIQKLHPEVISLKLAEILKHHVGFLTRQLVDELEGRIDRGYDAGNEP